MRTGLLAVSFLALLTQSVQPQPPIVVEVRVQFNGNTFGVMLDRPFGLVGIRCPPETGQRTTTIAGVLGSTLKSLTVRAYHSSRFPSERDVTDFIRAMLVARPENGELDTGVWSEGTDLDISIISEWNDGRFGRFDLGRNGNLRYVHLEDHRGCEWWSRFKMS